MPPNKLESDFKSIHPTDLSTHDGKSDFDILRVPLYFDLELLHAQLKKVRSHFPWHTKDALQGYDAIGLQFSDLALQFTDAIEATSNYEEVPGETYPQPKLLRPFRLYEKINPAGLLFGSVFRRLHPVRLFRSRLLTAHAGFEMAKAHVDGDVSVRLHVPIETNPEAWVEIEGRRYHLPADGSGYLVNTARLHRIGNPGSSSRTHLVSVIYRNFPGHIHDLAQSAYIRFIEGPLGGLRKNVIAANTKAISLANGRCHVCGEARTLYGVPTPARELKALCAPCIENVGRIAESKQGHGDQAVDRFETEVERASSKR